MTPLKPHWKRRETILVTCLQQIATGPDGAPAKAAARDALLRASGYEPCSVQAMFEDPPGVSPVTLEGLGIVRLEHESGRIYVAHLADGRVATYDAGSTVYYEPCGEDTGTGDPADDDSSATADET